MKELKQKYIDILEENDWSVSSYTDDGRVELQKYSPAGEDFSIIVEVENFTEAVREYANDFDANEHAAMWIEARGKVNGVPESIKELIDDAEEIQEMLNELADAVEGIKHIKSVIMNGLVKYIENGELFSYELSDGGSGIVIVDNVEEAEYKVKTAYKRHGGYENENLEEVRVDIFALDQKPFNDAPDVLEIFE